jgi:methylmalonyl-CoA mutase
MFDLFEGATARREDWLERVARFDAKVARALHPRTHGPRAERAEPAPWTIFQRVDHPDPAQANDQALDDLNNGARGLTLVFKDHPCARRYGITPRDLPRILHGIALHAIAVRVEGGQDAATALKTFIAAQPLDPDKLDISFGQEPDGRPAHDQGATDAQELGVVLAGCAKHLSVREQVPFGATLAADQDMFATLAKFRATRLLWSRIAATPLRLHAETSWRMMATLDPHLNILRAGAAVFGAALGGADTICVLPFSLAQGLPNAFARRVARNVQNIMIAEANLWRVADPAAGAGYVEHLTQRLREEAWTVFQATQRGEWPVFDPSNAESLPIIGTSTHRLPTEYPPEVAA